MRCTNTNIDTSVLCLGVDKYDPKLYPEKEFQMRWLKDYLEAWHFENGCSDEITEKAVELLYIQVNKFALVNIYISIYFE